MHPKGRDPSPPARDRPRSPAYPAPEASGPHLDCRPGWNWPSSSLAHTKTGITVRAAESAASSAGASYVLRSRRNHTTAVSNVGSPMLPSERPRYGAAFW
jgi:hypothetical protein